MSSETFQAPVGTHDVLGPKSADWEGLLAKFAYLAYQWGFQLVISPMFEDVGVFNRGIGEESDVAKKEMYVFTDRGNRTFALRPEGTASVVRAFVEHHPTTPWKVWYATPAFRYERPQAGRYRQHHQIGVEVLGTEDPQADVEVISLAARFYTALGLKRTRLLINSMGCINCRPQFVAALSKHLMVNEAGLCEEHKTKWSTNPLRVLDCKKSSCVDVTNEGPRLRDYLCAQCSEHFLLVQNGLQCLNIPYVLNDRLVRGFDYYTRTTFEFVSDALESSQNAIGGGGRYDQLVEQLGGPATAGIGFGSGIERLLIAREAEGLTKPLANRSPQVFIVDTTNGTAALEIADELRQVGVSVVRAFDNRSMKAQMKLADRSGAQLALLVGPQELADGLVTLRDLRSGYFDKSQRAVQRNATTAEVMKTLNEMIENE
jgi:histidyl-tRNA synthetase